MSLLCSKLLFRNPQSGQTIHYCILKHTVHAIYVLLCSFCRCYNCGDLDHHAKECKLPPQPKKCHFCQSIDHMVANCPIKAQQSSPGSQGKPSPSKGDNVEEEEHSLAAPPPEASD